MNRLDKYIKQIRGISYNPKDISEVQLEDYLPILKANNIQENGLETSKLIYIHKSKIKEEQLIKKGDLLLAASSGSKDIVGKNVFFENDFNGSFGAFCKVVRPNQNIYPRFLSVFFKTPLYKRHIRSLIQGVNINNLRNEDIDSLKIPEFSQQEQLHIANLLCKAENLITQRKQSIALLDEFLKSTFLEMFGDPVRNEKGWKLKLLSDCGKSRLGKMLDAKQIIGNNLKPYLRNSNVQWFSFKLDDLLEMDFDEKDKLEFSLKYGDILMCEGGEIGRCAIWKNQLQDCYFQKAIHRIRLNEEFVLPAYFVYMFRLYTSNGGLKIYMGAATISHLTGENLKKLKLPIPPIELQTQFAQIVGKTEALKVQYQNSLQELENLYGSLSQRAFRGELTLKHAEEQVLMAAEPEGKYQANSSK